ncbi:MAG: hypothetical protein GSR72_05675 [Desulfurococcales archaeon]|nr:hypothetical protein [Desulfurococcales archaeon]MEB3789361.1 hypothetical protein [Desulfurococcales archaeon]
MSLPEDLKINLTRKLREDAEKYKSEKISRLENHYNEKKKDLLSKYQEAIEEFTKSLQ